jgi:general secretion pathway protein C
MPAERRRLLILGGIAGLLVLVLAYMMLAGPEVPPATPSPPPPPPPVAAAPPPAPPPVAPAASPEGLRLHGVTGAGAIIAMPDGNQRLVRLGRDVLPGLKLEQVRLDHALLRSAAGAFRLDFTGVTAAGAPAVPVQPAAADEAAQREETLRYRLGLEPRRVGERIASHVVRPGANLPVLQRAGLRPGDVILRVNGSQLDEERLAELAWTIANSERVEFEIERDGRPMRLATNGGLSR